MSCIHFHKIMPYVFLYRQSFPLLLSWFIFIRFKRKKAAYVLYFFLMLDFTLKAQNCIMACITYLNYSTLCCPAPGCLAQDAGNSIKMGVTFKNPACRWANGISNWTIKGNYLNHSLIKHGIGHFQESGNIGSFHVIHVAVLIFSILYTRGVDVGHDLVQPFIHLIS